MINPVFPWWEPVRFWGEGVGAGIRVRVCLCGEFEGRSRGDDLGTRRGAFLIGGEGDYRDQVN